MSRVMTTDPLGLMPPGAASGDPGRKPRRARGGQNAFPTAGGGLGFGNVNNNGPGYGVGFGGFGPSTVRNSKFVIYENFAFDR